MKTSGKSEKLNDSARLPPKKIFQVPTKIMTLYFCEHSTVQAMGIAALTCA